MRSCKKGLDSEVCYTQMMMVHMPLAGIAVPHSSSVAHLELDIDLDLARRLVSSFTVGSILDQGCEQGPCPILHPFDRTMSKTSCSDWHSRTLD